MINELTELAGVINRHKISHASLVDAGFLKDSNSITRLYNAVADNKILTDNDAKKLLYGEESKSDEQYRKLKSRLRRRLLNTIFVIDYEDKGGYTIYQKAYINCHRDWALIKLLQAYGCRNTFINLAKELLSAAQKWQFTDITIMTAQVLSTASSFEGNTKLQAQYRLIAESAQQQYLDEMQCQMEFDEITGLLHHSKGANPARNKQVVKKLDSIKSYAENYPQVYKIQLLEKRAGLTFANLNGDINRVLDFCEEGEKLIKSFPDFYSSATHAEFVLNHMVSYLQLKNYSQAIAYYQRTRDLLQAGSGHFTTLQFYFVLSLIHAGRYEEAAAAFNIATEHRLYKSQTPPMLIRWRLVEASLNFIAREGLIKNTKLKVLQGRNFSILKLSSDIGKFAEDKAGINLVLRVLLSAFSIQDGNFKKLSQQQDSFYTYISRYLKDQENQSAILFMQLSNTLISSNFRISSNPDKINELYTQLVNLPPSHSQDVTIDVLPYTWLWQAIAARCNK